MRVATTPCVPLPPFAAVLTELGRQAWTKVGVDSAFAIEATFEDSNTGNIHSGRDTIDVDGFSFDHMRQFVRLATAFVLELSS